jgi:ribose-phosphate pyrophosphokinase
LGVEVSPCRIERYSNDNLYVQLLESVRDKEVFIVQTLAPPVHEHLFELMLLLDAARSTSAGNVTAVIPHYSYARSDKKDEPRISIAGRLVADLLVTAGASHVITMTLHSPQVHGFFSVPMDHLTALGTLVPYFQQKDHSGMCIVSPDIGNARRAIKFARALGLPMVAGSKERVADDRVEFHGLIGEVPGDRAIIYDDEIANAGTMMPVMAALKAQGVREFYLACTHGLFSGPAIERLSSVPEIAEIVTTNTLPIPPEKRLPIMKVLSVAPVFAEAIRRNVTGESVAPLFAY